MREFTQEIFPTIPQMGAVSVDLDLSIFLPRTGTHTSPPCTHDVKWLIMHYPVNVTQNLISGVRDMINLRYFGGNARDARKVELGFEITTRPKPQVGGELLLTTSTSLTPAQVRSLTHRHVEWAAESSVIDLARMWSKFYGTPKQPSEEGFAFQDEWSVLLNGRPAGDDVVTTNWFALSSSEIGGSIFSNAYSLTDKCVFAYTWEHRFIPVRSLEGCSRTNGTISASACARSKSSSKLNPPMIAPGSHLLQPVAKPQDADYQITDPSLRGIVEQAVKPAGDLIHLMPDWEVNQ
eukprot:c9481_g1_i1.p1 GENE.c9481_g1_i1~~c9481_g1_i1.p1  ORF type:complete len:293 (+),score=63.04 c9481_g1_i1:659-1537(+)